MIYAYTTADSWATNHERARIQKRYSATAGGGAVAPENMDTMSASFIFDVNNTTTDQFGLQFNFGTDTDCVGDSNKNRTFVNFVKLAE